MGGKVKDEVGRICRMHEARRNIRGNGGRLQCRYCPRRLVSYVRKGVQMPRKVEMYAVNRAKGAFFVFFFFGCREQGQTQFSTC